MKRFVIIWLHLAPAITCWSQDNIGIAGSSRSPVNTVLINPSSIVDSRAFLDFNLVGASAFARNNFAYIPGESFSVSGISEMTEASFARQNAPYKGYLDLMAHGPSVTFNVKSSAFGLHTSVRTMADASGITESLGYYLTEGFQYNEQMGEEYMVNDLRAHGLAWMELGATYGTIISRKDQKLVQAGVTLKRLIGIGGAGLDMDEWNYSVVDSSQIETYAAIGQYGYNEPAFNSGRGFGFDLGITIKNTGRDVEGYVPFSPCTEGDYLYKFGFSVLDVGAIRFDQPFYRSVFNENDLAEWDDYSDVSADDAADLDSLLNYGLGLPATGPDENKLKLKLPTAVSAQIDYNVGNNIYLFGIVTYGLPRKNNLGNERASYIAIAPRYEIKRFEVSLPVTLYEFQNPQLGLMLRLNSIIIGTDMIGPWITNRDVYGLDLYFNFKYTIFRNWNCRDSKEKKPKTGKSDGKVIPCPSW